ncbi:MAG: ROK family protein [Actinobacteria bacterium]|nr:ROK family protein [Actinomycetota bacterium]
MGIYNASAKDLKLKILNVIRNKGQVTKQEIARYLNFNLTTITNLVNELLISHKLLQEVGDNVSTGGRKPKLYQININSGNIIGLDIGGENLRIVMCDIMGNVISSLTSRSQYNGNREKLIDGILNLIEKIIANAGYNKSSIFGIGISISGIVDSDSGNIIYCPNIDGLDNFQIKNFLESKTDFSVFVDDSVRCMAIAEKHYGIAKEYDNFLFISLGKGIGMGIYVNGKIYRGSIGLSGELGHITVNEDGPLCNCGNKGCLEAIASGPGIIRRAREGIENGIVTLLTQIIKGDLKNLTVETISKAAEEGDKFSYYLINRTGEYIGIAVAAVLNLFGPELVVLGGGVAKCGDVMIDAIRRTVQLRALSVISKKARIVRSELEDNIAARGAATKFINILFNDPNNNLLSKII